MADDLAIWLYGDKVATLTELRHKRLRLQYSSRALALYELGAPLLSVALPLIDAYYAPATTKAFIDGLLPEEDQRRTVAEELELVATDTFGLIGRLGRDCAGALIIQPASEPLATTSSTLTSTPLSDEEVGIKVVNLRSAPLGISKDVRISLAGVQEKLLLTRRPDRSWGTPTEGAPSTHILKPEIRDYPNSVENEAFCMRVARNLGLRVASVEAAEYGERKVLVVERFDRVVKDNGNVERIHHEDFCQVMSMPPRQKYQHDGGPSLLRIAKVLRDSGRPDSLRRLLEYVFVNVLVGNGDAHGKNFSLLHHRDGSVELTPLYDVMSTLYYGDDALAMYVDNVHKTSRVTRDRLRNEALSWGLKREVIDVALDELIARVPDAVSKAVDETPGTPEEILSVIERQLSALA